MDRPNTEIKSKIFQCDLCCKTFAQKAYLRIHIATIHGETI